MSRKQRPETDYIFIIRLWREPTGSKSGGSWRGQLYHRNRRHHFVGLRQLFAMIRDTPDEIRAMRQTEKERRRSRGNGAPSAQG